MALSILSSVVNIPNVAVLTGAFRPMRFEATVEDCAITFGEIPKALSGGFYRVGPTFKRPTKQGGNGLLAMDGMVQGLTFDNGRADFRNRWVRTPKYLLEDRHGRGMFQWADGEWSDWRNIGFGAAVHDKSTRGIRPEVGLWRAVEHQVRPFAGGIDIAYKVRATARPISSMYPDSYLISI